MAKTILTPWNFPTKNSKMKVSNYNESPSFTAIVRMSTNELIYIYTNKNKNSSPSKRKPKETTKQGKYKKTSDSESTLKPKTRKSFSSTPKKKNFVEYDSCVSSERIFISPW